MITFLSGGTGTARLLRGVRQILYDREIAVVAGTAEDLPISGNRCSPEIDTTMFLFAGILNTRTWWGVAGGHVLDAPVPAEGRRRRGRAYRTDGAAPGGQDALGSDAGAVPCARYCGDDPAGDRCRGRNTGRYRHRADAAPGVHIWEEIAESVRSGRWSGSFGSRRPPRGRRPPRSRGAMPW